jgi:hypothetical protein
VTLFLDDSPARARWAMRNLEGVVWVKTAAECIAALDRPWDAVYLDHDLDGEWQDWREKNTGTEVVRWILTNRPAIGRVVVHSLNSPAANRMAKALSRRGYAAEYVSFLTLVNDRERECRANKESTP